MDMPYYINPYQQPQQPPISPYLTNEQRMQQILQSNPQLAAQFGFMPQQPMQQQPPQQQQSSAQMGLKGRPVSGIEEARAAQIDLDGSIHVFTDVANNRIYTKQLGLNGAAIFEVYERQAPVATPTPTPAQVPTLSMQDLETMCSVLSTKMAVLENRLNEIGGNNNERNESTTVVRPVAKQRKSDGNAPADGGQ